MSNQFDGFVPPTKNYFPVPNNWIDICADIRDISELKVIQYVIRHTWGFHEFGICKTISVDEFMHGRRRQDQSRMDKGTGLSEQSVRNGLKKAIKDGYLVCETDPSDAGRIKKSYALRMQADNRQVQTLDPPQTLDPSTGTNFIPQGTNPYTSDYQSLDPRVPNFIPRTEKDTIETHLGNTPKKESTIVNSASAEVDAPAPIDLTEQRKKRDTEPRIPAISLKEQTPQQIATVPPVEEQAATAPVASVDTPQVNVQRGAMAMTARQIKAQAERREKEVWSIIEQERNTKYTDRQRKLYGNAEGVKCLIADDISDETLRDGLKRLDAFQSKSFTVLKFYEWLPNLSVKAPIPMSKPAESNGVDHERNQQRLAELTRRFNEEGPKLKGLELRKHA